MCALPGGITCGGGSKSLTDNARFSSLDTPERRQQRPPPVTETGVYGNAANQPTSHTYWKTASVHKCLFPQLPSVRKRFAIHVAPHFFACHEALAPLSSSLLLFARPLILERNAHKHKWRRWRGAEEGRAREWGNDRSDTKKDIKRTWRTPPPKKKRKTLQKECTATRRKEITTAKSRWKRELGTPISVTHSHSLVWRAHTWSQAYKKKVRSEAQMHGVCARTCMCGENAHMARRRSELWEGRGGKEKRNQREIRPLSH